MCRHRQVPTHRLLSVNGIVAITLVTKFHKNRDCRKFFLSVFPPYPWHKCSISNNNVSFLIFHSMRNSSCDKNSCSGCSGQHSWIPCVWCYPSSHLIHLPGQASMPDSGWSLGPCPTMILFCCCTDTWAIVKLHSTSDYGF